MKKIYESPKVTILSTVDVMTASAPETENIPFPIDIGASIESRYELGD